MAILTATVLASPALADRPGEGGSRGGRPPHAEPQGGRDHGDLHGREGGRRREARPPVQDDVRFGERERAVVRRHFAEQMAAGRCPPGLAKKGNACMPPGHARKWAVGKPLPREVIFHDLPPAVVVELGPPPAGYRYVRVAADILMIAISTAMVVDAIEDIGRM